MASVSQRGGRWYVKYRNARGKWLRQVTTATTKTAAARFAAEIERRAERQRLGLEALLPEDGGGTLAEILQWWLDTYSKGRSTHPRDAYSVRKHFFGSALGGLRLVDVTSGRLEEFLQAKSATLGPQTINHLRRFVLTAFNRAKKAGRWSGANPAESVEARRVPSRAHDFLHAGEVLPLLRALEPRWLPLFAVAIYTGLRRGELLGLRKKDVNLPSGLLTVARSYGRDTTKGGHADTIPVPSEALPWLAEAIRSSPSELVFPHVCATSCAHQKRCPGPGGMMRSDTALEMVLRRAMGRAGLAENWKHVCRRRGCGYREQATSGELRRCPKCQMKLWPMPQPRPLRFHDLRHGTASLLFMAGADAVAVQKLMRHRDLRMTIGTYGHLTPGYMRAEVDRLRFLPNATGTREIAPSVPLGRLNPPSPAPPPPPPSVGNLNQLGPTLVQDGAGNEKAPRPGDRNPEEAWALVPARSTGLEGVKCTFRKRATAHQFPLKRGEIVRLFGVSPLPVSPLRNPPVCASRGGSVADSLGRRLNTTRHASRGTRPTDSGNVSAHLRGVRRRDFARLNPPCACYPIVSCS